MFTKDSSEKTVYIGANIDEDGQQT